MRTLSLLALALSGILIAAMPADAAPIGRAPVDIVELGAYQWHNHVVLVLAPNEHDRAFIQQREALTGQEAGIADRDLVVGMLTDDAGGELDDVVASPDAVSVLRTQLDAPKDQFAVVLIGKDGEVKLRQNTPITADTLFAVIDAMPMRQQGMWQQ